MKNNERASLENRKFKHAINPSSEMVDWRIEGIWFGGGVLLMSQATQSWWNSGKSSIIYE